MKIQIDEIKKTCLEILIGKGLSKEHALEVFEEYLDAELSGRTCHGFQAFPKFGAKLIDKVNEPEVLREEDNLLYLDGKKNLGQVVCSKYVPKLIQKAKDRNIAMMGIKNMHSYLKPGTYARMAAENNLVAFIFNYGGWKRIAPHGSIDPFFGTNPVAVGIPGKDFPVVIDMATSSIAMMKVRMADKLGEKLPEGVAMDKNGNPTTDPFEAMDGALYPFGGYKGSALALVVELITNTMFDIDIHNETKANRGFFFAFFNPEVFRPVDEFKESVSKLVDDIKNSRKADGVSEIIIPGEQGDKIKEENLKKGYVELDERIWEETKALL